MEKIKSFNLFIHSGVVLCLIILLHACTTNTSTVNKNVLSENEKKFYSGVGIGPIKEIQIDATINSSMTAIGEKIFQAKCFACHQLSEERRIGPGLKGISKRRRPEWIMNQMMNPTEMTLNDSLSKELLKIYLTQMTNMNLTQDDARNILEYLRQNDSGNSAN